MNMKIEDLGLVYGMAVFGWQPKWESVCVILIFGIIKAICVFFNRQAKAIDMIKIEEKIAKVAQDIKNVNLRLGFQRA